MCRRSVLALVMLAHAGCGRLGFGAVDGVLDAPADDAPLEAGIDAPSPDAPSLDASSPDAPSDDAGLDAADAGSDAGTALPTFAPPSPIAELASPLATEDPTLTADRLEIFFNRSSDIYRATRASTTSPWSTPTAVAELNSGSTDSSPEVSSDGLRIYFSSQRGGNLDVYLASRASRTDPWGAPVRVAELSSTSFETNPTPRTDGLELFLSRGASSTTRDVHRARRASTADAWGVPTAVAELSSGSNDGGAMAALGGTLVVFFSDRAGDDDLYAATRASDAVPFGAPVPIAEVSAIGTDEEDPWISEDGRHLVFARDGQLFETTR